MRGSVSADDDQSMKAKVAAPSSSAFIGRGTTAAIAAGSPRKSIPMTSPEKCQGGGGTSEARPWGESGRLQPRRLIAGSSATRSSDTSVGAHIAGAGPGVGLAVTGELDIAELRWRGDGRTPPLRQTILRVVVEGILQRGLLVAAERGRVLDEPARGPAYCVAGGHDIAVAEPVTQLRRVHHTMGRAVVHHHRARGHGELTRHRQQLPIMVEFVGDDLDHLPDA